MEIFPSLILAKGSECYLSKVHFCEILTYCAGKIFFNYLTARQSFFILAKYVFCTACTNAPQSFKGFFFFQVKPQTSNQSISLKKRKKWKLNATGNSYFLHWNFVRKSCVVVFFLRVKKSTIQLLMSKSQFRR